MAKYRVIVIDENPGRAAVLERALLDNGYEVVAKVAPGVDLPKLVHELQPDVIIIDMESPDRDILEDMHNITREQPKPIVMFSDQDDSAVIEAAVRAGVSAYIVDGLEANRVKPILDVAVARFREFQALRDELDKTKATLEERKVIEKAKGILMKQRGFDEGQAYKALRSLAMNKNKRLIDVARDVVAVSELLTG